MDQMSELIKAKSVRIGNIWLPTKSIAETLARYIKPLMGLSGYADIPYYLRGSMTAFRVMGQYNLTFCRHQIDCDLKDFSEKYAVFIGSGKREGLITGGRFRFSETHLDEELSDAVALEVDPAVLEIPNLESEFFQVLERDCWPNRSENTFMVLGLPTSQQGWDLNPGDGKLLAINFQKAIIIAEYQKTSHARYVHRAKMVRSSDFSSDGMSGGPVFHLGCDADGFFIGLAGMIVRGGASDHFYFIEAAHLLRLASS